MDAYTNAFRLSSEHREFAKDVAMLVISYTPLTGFLYTAQFLQKWFGKRGVHARVATYMARNDRKNFIKSRGRRIRASRPCAVAV
ncbi:MAG: hypothetical protein KGH94_03975 [Candidatus Micrarchaeota archaeon]|nr:hypothetical protein [Candidatus Micrarchaeota archaeon]